MRRPGPGGTENHSITRARDTLHAGTKVGQRSVPQAGVINILFEDFWCEGEVESISLFLLSSNANVQFAYKMFSLGLWKLLVATISKATICYQGGCGHSL